MAKLERSDKEWRETLTPEQYRVLREAGTEAPFSGTLLNNKAAGEYVCAGCGEPLLSSDGKFDSGCGWPSFTRPADADAVMEQSDDSHGMHRVEVRCAKCEGHLGHVFPDGPGPTGLRYCINSAALGFTCRCDEPSPAPGEHEKGAVD
jgi:peptide-methionine (R)-S-oxide reductase